MTFGDAIAHMRSGGASGRRHWPVRGQWIIIGPYGYMGSEEFEINGGKYGRHLWSPTSEDALAEDWEILRIYAADRKAVRPKQARFSSSGIVFV